MEQAIYIFLLAMGASFVQRTTGFGFGIFIMSMLPYLLPSYGEATTLSGLLAMSTSAVIAVRMRRFINWKRLLPILVTFVITSAGAICLLARTDDSLLRRILGIVLIITGIYFAFFSKRIHLKPTLPYQIGAGTLSGMMGGFFGMQGPPAVLYFISSEPDKNCYMAISQTYFVIGNAMMTIVRASNGFLTAEVGKGYIIGIGGLVAGMALGSWAYRHISDRIFPYIVYTYIAISGIVISLQA